MYNECDRITVIFAPIIVVVACAMCICAFAVIVVAHSLSYVNLVYAFLFVVLESFIHLIELQAKRHKPIEINRSIKYSSSFFRNGLHRPKFEHIDIDFGWVEGRSNGHFVLYIVCAYVYIHYEWKEHDKRWNIYINIYISCTHSVEGMKRKEATARVPMPTNIFSRNSETGFNRSSLFFVVARAYRFRNSIQFVNIFIIFFISAISYPCKPVN